MEMAFMMLILGGSISEKLDVAHGGQPGKGPS